MSSVLYSAVLILFLQAGYVTALIRWPKGNYALLKPKSGCPDEWKENGWEENGSIFQDMDYNGNEHSADLHVSGRVNPKNVSRYFCIKSDTTGSTNWPTGKYCIYSKWISGLNWGIIRMYDNLKSVVSPTCKNYFASSYWSYIELHFACQTRGDRKIPIELPISKPFYLLPYGSRECQQVKWMVATTEWIKYHSIYGHRSSSFPHSEVLSKWTWRNHIKMYYCYYESCNYTLNEANDVFQSPGFPGRYPDGQLCSWRIIVPANHTITVNFTIFSLYEYDKDCLQIFEKTADIFQPTQAFFGHRQPFIVTGTRDLLFVFRSDEVNNSTGFRAEYEILKIPERTTTAKPPTTTKKPTTTQTTIKIVTTKLPTTQLQTTQLPTTQPPTTRPQSTKPMTTKQPITIEEKAFTSTETSANLTTNDTVQNRWTSNNHKSSINHDLHSLKKTCFCDETWRIVVMVIPVIGFILIVVITMDIFCRYRYKNTSKNATSGNVEDGLVVNPTYERGDINLDQPADPKPHDSALINTVDDQTLSCDEPLDYEDIDYTQLNEVPPPNKETDNSERHALNPAVNNAPEAFYHVLEPPIADLDRPTYQNLSDVNHYTLNPIYDSAQNSSQHIHM